MSIFGVLNVAKQGLLSHQRAISVTSNNISNVNTPGYTRQRAVFSPLAPTFLPSGLPLGGGVDVASVERVVDQTLDNQLQQERQSFAFQQGMEAGLARIEGVFEELGGTGVSSALTDFFRSLNDLANAPESGAARQNVVQMAQSLVGLVHDADRRLAQLQTDANGRIETDLAEINRIAADIAQVNERIFATELNDATASALRDERNNLLGQLGEKIDFTTAEQSDGRLTVFVAGGMPLVDGNAAATLQTTTVQPAPGLSDPTFFHVEYNLDGSVAGPITDRITGGSLGSTISLRDDRLVFYREQLDRFAFTLASRVNAVHAAGRGLEDASSRNLFVDPTIGGPNPPGDPPATVAGAAAAIEVNADIVANARHLAAGRPSAGAADTGDNTNALLLAQLESDASAFYEIGDTAGSPTGSASTLGGFFDTLAGVLGAEIQSTQRGLSQQELVVAELENRRGAISGVSIDEETTNLVAFQRAYQASARVISMVDEMLQQLLSI